MLRDRISKEEFIKKYNSTTTTNLAKELGVTRQTIITMAKKYNLPHKKRTGKPKKTFKISKKELEKMYRTNKTKDVARCFGCSIVTLLRVLKENGIELKKVGHGVRSRKIIVEG